VQQIILESRPQSYSVSDGYSVPGTKLAIQPPSGSEIKDILNFIVVAINIIGTTIYNHMCLEGAGLCLGEE
jgi:hypothetical protein